MGNTTQIIGAKRKIARIIGMCCELVGGLILWMLVVMLIRNGVGFTPADIPELPMLLVGGGLLLLGMGLSGLGGKTSQGERNHA